MRYLILGTTAVRDTPLPGARLRSLLAALALTPGRAVPVETLIDGVWASDPPADAPGALQALVSRLRRAIGRDAIGSGPAGYTLRARPDDVDLHVFARLVEEAGTSLDAGDAAAALTALDEALALWRGPALADLANRTAAAARPEALRLTALRRRIDACLALGRADQALPQAGELVAAHPLNEPFRAQLIRALHDLGRSADALAAYEEGRGLLADRLGADPGPELRALHARLLDGGEATPPAAPRRSGAPRGNLRPRLTSFVGREDELRAIRADVARHRLVTLAGPGGAGKTRLAERAGGELAGQYPDGVWAAELAPVDHASGVPRAVLNAVGRSDTTVFGSIPASSDPTERLVEHCAHRRMLLVLDNCEHVVGAAAELAEALLSYCPGVTVLATSREPLGVPGEVVRPVGPLPPSTARRLFAERAAAVRPGLDTEGDAGAIAEICRRLDGLPLGIELAAARLRLLTPRQIADRLDDRFRLLTSGSRTVMPRQQTLRAVVDWSWELLTEPERAVLRRLSVFSGGCDLLAAEAVCADGRDIRQDEVLGVLGSLVDKSLVVADRHADPDGVRYRLLETIQEYAAEHATDHPGESRDTGLRHTAYFRALIEAAAPVLRTAAQLPWLGRLEREMDNIRVALGRALDARDEDVALAMVLGLGWFWWLRNYRDEGLGWIRRTIALGGLPDDEDDPRFGPRMDLRLMMFFTLSDQVAASDLHGEQAKALARRMLGFYGRPGPHAARFPGLLWPFAGQVAEGPSRMRSLIATMVGTCRAHGDDWALACALMFRTHVAIDSPGGLDVALADWPELSRLAERVGDRWVTAQVRGASAEMAMARGRYDEARAEWQAAVRLCEELGARGEVPFLLARIAELAIRQGDDEQAAKLLVRAEEEADHYGIWDARTYVRCLQVTIALRAGDPAYARELCDTARSEAELGTPPPMFAAFLADLEAAVRAAEGDTHGALDAAREALRAGVASECAEQIIAAFLERTALLLTGDLARHRTAALLLGAADTLRGGDRLPRSVPEEETARQACTAVRAALGDAAADAAHAEGRRLTCGDALKLLDELAARVTRA
ncbi:BTAD domain-containing putative transcriptional regulator [Streptomyces sp. ICBB 8177]|uniref:ATP-binding protein n=1 Tax=Streptomyces sp. ICBB 8177 TaxID=563922 RepID=UPI001F53FDAD|nr:BTAD domain-containing putative transcriptional regulator [Streptomyces sp. ICBB 8177]